MMSLNVESEMEEGEIIDELDDLSNISSEEEFTWLRERAEILESYNNVLGRSKAKLSQNAGTKLVQLNKVWQELPEIGVTINNRRRIDKKYNVSDKSHMRMRRNFNKPKYDKRSDVNFYKREWAKKSKHSSKSRKVVSESSEFSEDEEIENKKIKLANAVTIQKNKIDKSTLKERLMKMTLNNKANLRKQSTGTEIPRHNKNDNSAFKRAIQKEKVQHNLKSKILKTDLEFETSNISNLLKKNKLCSVTNNKMLSEKVLHELDVHTDLTKESLEASDRSKFFDSLEDTNKKVPNELELQSSIKTCSDFSDSSVDYKNNGIETKEIDTESHEDCENKKEPNEENMEVPNFNAIYITPKSSPIYEIKDSEDDNSDTQELRLICLKSTALKKAIEKQKQKKKQIKKSLNVSTVNSKSVDKEVNRCQDNTDVDSVDMDMSDNDVIDDKNSDPNSFISNELVKKSTNDDDLDVLRLELLMSIETDAKKIEEHKRLIAETKKDVKEANVDNDVNNTTDGELSKNTTHKADIKKDSAQNRPNKGEIHTEINIENINSKLNQMEVNSPKTEKQDITNKTCTKSAKQEKADIEKPAVIKKDAKVTTDIKKSVIENDKNNLEKENASKNADLIIITNDSDSETEATKNLTKMHNKLAPMTVGSDFQKRLDFLLKSARSMVEKEISVKKTSEPEKPIVDQKFVPKAVEHLPKSARKEYNDLVKRMADLEKKMKAREAAETLRFKQSLKGRRVNMNNNPIGLEGHITTSRKNIAQESTRLLKLKEEKKKMAKRHNVLSVELLNLSTAMANNEKQTRFSQIKLNNFRAYHQALLKKVKQSNKGNPYKKLNIHDNKTVITRKVVANNNYKIRKPSIRMQNTKEVLREENKMENRTKYTKLCKDETKIKKKATLKPEKVDDYKSPLQAISKEAWSGDPNGVLCPFDVQGVCKDTSCKYIHSRLFIPSSS